MKTIYNRLLVLFVLGALSACTLDDIQNPNAPTVSSFENGASQQDLILLTTGLEAIMRNDMGFHYQTVSILGREYNDLTQVDPRYTGELVIGTALDNNGFLTTRAYAAWYKIVQTANVLIEAVNNSATSLSEAELDGYRGYARTIKAYALLMVANRQFSNGIRVDVDDPDNLGPFVSYAEALTAIRGMLESANTELSNAGAAFDFPLSSGFAGFDTPATFAEFNRGLAARVAIYQGDDTAALGFLANSFMDEAGSMDMGPAHTFGLTGNDISNPLFYVPNQQRYMAHPSFSQDAEAGDGRVDDNTSLFDDTGDSVTDTVRFDGLTGWRQVTQFASNVAPVPIMKNVELLLIYAEANIGTNNVEALRVLNIVRASAGLGASTANPAVDAEVVDEMLNQRRYSLFGLGHRWVDLRRYNRLSDLPLDRAGDTVAEEFPTPFAENQ
ncbi:RagB/SusD family nutrient uptake outer membrane protein [Ekhidna sp.]|uniref:RagB/SusD family nutrient uptake outer membrane protein n=1 Tax=Ekhidna sp. TaxID=2608089 RepID=UPI003B514A63